MSTAIETHDLSKRYRRVSALSECTVAWEDLNFRPYLQIVRQVRQALRMGVLNVGDQLPSVREVVAAVAVNPNTVLKAYRDLEREGPLNTANGQIACWRSSDASLRSGRR